MSFFSQFIRKSLKVWVLILPLSIASACTAQEIGKFNNMAIQICPEESIEEAKAAFELKESDQNLSLNELLNRIFDKGYDLEKKRYGVTRYKCPDSEIAPDTEVQFVYAGFDETNQYTREFVIITDANNIVEKIEVRRAYVAPGR